MSEEIPTTIILREDAQKLTGLINKRFDKVDQRIENLEKSTNERFDKVDERFEKMDRKLDKQTEILQMIAKNIKKPK